jgi:hypothetical protein
MESGSAGCQRRNAAIAESATSTIGRARCLPRDARVAVVDSARLCGSRMSCGLRQSHAERVGAVPALRSIGVERTVDHRSQCLRYVRTLDANRRATTSCVRCAHFLNLTIVALERLTRGDNSSQVRGGRQ